MPLNPSRPTPPKTTQAAAVIRKPAVAYYLAFTILECVLVIAIVSAWPVAILTYFVGSYAAYAASRVR